jgi:aminoglycoside phosphotransferase (APT) family kinase protein
MAIEAECGTFVDDPFGSDWIDVALTEKFLLKSIKWKALEEYALAVYLRYHNDHKTIVTLSTETSMGGRNVVRRLDFSDGTSWVARCQRHKTTPESIYRLIREVSTLQLVRERSKVPVPEVFAYEANDANPVGVPFMIMEYIPGSTAMHSFGGWATHGGRTPEHFKKKFLTTMADIQVSLPKTYGSRTSIH